MRCEKCGAELDLDSKFCEVCGAKVGSGSQSAGEGSSSSEKASNSFSDVWGGSLGSFFINHRGDEDFFCPVDVDTKKIRKWFTGGSKIKIWIILGIVGLLMVMAEMIVGWVILAAGVAGLVMCFRSSGEEIVDNARNECIEALTKRGLGKLNLIDEQVKLIDPVVLVGVGESPDDSFIMAKVNSQKNSNLLGSLFGSVFFIFTIPYNKIRSFFVKDGTETDPEYATKIGSDGVFRSMLISVTVYWFSEEQLLTYKGNIDISTGMVYQEDTQEVFYKDIEGICTEQHVYKVFSAKKKNYINKAFESVVLHLSGHSISASYAREMNASGIQEQFSAMRDLIRDKKNK